MIVQKMKINHRKNSKNLGSKNYSILFCSFNYYYFLLELKKEFSGISVKFKNENKINDKRNVVKL